MIARNPNRRHRRRRCDAAEVPDDITADNLHLLDRHEPIAITPTIVEMIKAAELLTTEEEEAGLLDDKGGEVVVTAGALRRILARLDEGTR